MASPPQTDMASGTPLAERRFLAVDDERVTLDVVEATLKSAGASVVAKATSVFAARDAIEKALLRFDGIICDQGMFPTTGLQFLQEVRMGGIEKLGRGVCFVMLTSAKESETVETAMALDASGYVVKPFDRERLVTAVARAMKKSILLKPPHHYSALKI